MAHNTQRHEKFRAEEKEVISVPKKANPLDIWGTTAPSKTANGRQNRVLGAANKVGITQVPNILTPHGGESYNPSGDAHQALLQTIVNIDDKLVNGIQMPSRVKDLSKFDAQSKKAKPRSKKEAKIQEELEIKRKIKENVLMEYNYGKFLKDANKDKKDQKKKLEIRDAHKAELKKKLFKGELQPTLRKIGSGTYIPRAKEFEDFDKIRGVLKETSGDMACLLRDQYDNIFRTGKIEPVKAGKNKQRKYREFKAHNIYETSMETRLIKTRMAPIKGNEEELKVL